MKLTGRQKDVLEEFGSAWLYYIRRSPIMTGGESEDEANENEKARVESEKMQTAVNALCNMLGLIPVINFFNIPESGLKRRLDFLTLTGRELVYSVKEP